MGASKTQPASNPGGAASPSSWQPSTPSAATSAPVTDSEGTASAGETSAVRLDPWSPGASREAEGTIFRSTGQSDCL